MGTPFWEQVYQKYFDAKQRGDKPVQWRIGIEVFQVLATDRLPNGDFMVSMPTLQQQALILGLRYHIDYDNPQRFELEAIPMATIVAAAGPLRRLT